MPKLTDKQLVILNAAAGRDDRRALPLPSSLKLAKAPAASLLAGLVKRRLLDPRQAGNGEEVWREDSDTRLTLIVSDAGLAALGIDKKDHARPQMRNSEKPAKSRKGVRPDTVATDKAPRPATKLATVVDLLRRSEGATVPEIMVATNWQAHSVRGAISGTVKKKLGLSVVSDVEDGRGRVHRIVTDASDATT